jgi:hypothetical protein
MRGPGVRTVKPDAPCKGCEKRHEACHDSCEEFKAYKEKQLKIARKRREYASERAVDVARSENKKINQGWNWKRDEK